MQRGSHIQQPSLHPVRTAGSEVQLLMGWQCNAMKSVVGIVTAFSFSSLLSSELVTPQLAMGARNWVLTIANWYQHPH